MEQPPPLATPVQAEFDAMKKELEETKQELEETKKLFEHTKEAFKTAVFTLKEDYDRLNEDNDRLNKDNDRLQDKNDTLEERNTMLEKTKEKLEKQINELQHQIAGLQHQITELTTKKEEQQPRPASPNRPTTLQKWIFCQYLLKVDPTKKIYNTFRNKWLGVTILAQRLGGDFLEDVDALNHQSIESLEGMIDRLKDLYEEHKHDEIKAALKYLIQAQIDFPNA